VAGEGVDWINLAQNRHKDIRVSYNAGNSSNSWGTSSISRRLFFMVLLVKLVT